MFHECQTLVHQVNNKISRCPSPQQSKLAKNVMSSVARELQDLSGQFRKSQSDYLESGLIKVYSLVLLCNQLLLFDMCKWTAHTVLVGVVVLCVVKGCHNSSKPNMTYVVNK